MPERVQEVSLPIPRVLARNVGSTVSTSIITIVILFSSQPIMALRVKGFVPPPYYERVVFSAFTVVPVSVILALSLYYLMRVMDPSRCKTQMRGFVRAVFLIALLGCFVAAFDGLNDEGCNPSLWSSPFLAAYFPLSVLLLNRRMHVALRFCIAVVSYVLLMIPVSLLASLWQDYGERVGLPTSW